MPRKPPRTQRRTDVAATLGMSRSALAPPPVSPRVLRRKQVEERVALPTQPNLFAHGAGLVSRAGEAGKQFSRVCIAAYSFLISERRQFPPVELVPPGGGHGQRMCLKACRVCHFRCYTHWSGNPLTDDRLPP